MTVALATQRVLVVDDDPAVVVTLAESLRLERYSVATAGQAADGLSLVEREAFAVIISDQRMPGMSGLEFFQRARQLQPHASRVLLTGVADVAVLVQAINAGEIYRFLMKPWLPAELIATVALAAESCRERGAGTEWEARYRELEEANVALKRKLQHTLAWVAQLQAQRSTRDSTQSYI